MELFEAPYDTWHIWFDKIIRQILKLDLDFSREVQCKDQGDPQVASTALLVPCPRIETLCTGIRDKAGFGNNAKYPHLQNRDAIRGGEVKPRLHSALLCRPAREPVTHNR